MIPVYILAQEAMTWESTITKESHFLLIEEQALRCSWLSKAAASQCEKSLSMLMIKVTSLSLLQYVSLPIFLTRQMSYHQRPLTGHILLVPTHLSNPLGGSLIQRSPYHVVNQNPLEVKPSGESMVCKYRKTNLHHQGYGLLPHIINGDWRWRTTEEVYKFPELVLGRKERMDGHMLKMLGLWTQVWQRVTTSRPPSQALSALVWYHTECWFLLADSLMSFLPRSFNIRMWLDTAFKWSEESVGQVRSANPGEAEAVFPIVQLGSPNTPALRFYLTPPSLRGDRAQAMQAKSSTIKFTLHGVTLSPSPFL